jgi:hypothetical protein
VKEIATSLQIPTISAWNPVSISNPNRPLVGHTCASVEAGAMVAIV